MTSLVDNGRCLRHRTSMMMIIILVVLLIAGVSIWNRFGAHNLFDSIMDAEWNSPSVERHNSAVKDKYSGGMQRGGGQPFEYYRQRLVYHSISDSLWIDITPNHDENDCSELGCKTTWWQEKFPTRLVISHSIFDKSRDGDGAFIKLVLTYNRPARILEEHVEVWSLLSDGSEGDYFRVDNVIAAIFLTENGLTRDYLQQERDHVYNMFLTDFLTANPSISYTVEEWGHLRINSDQFLT